MSRCKTEQECLYQPWCKINGKCYRDVTPPSKLTRCPICGVVSEGMVLHEDSDMADLARQLERELAEALEENDAMAKDYLELGRRLEAAQSATPQSDRNKIIEECAQICEQESQGEGITGTYQASWGQHLAREIRRLSSASARKDEAKCCCAGFFTESGYCPVHGPIMERTAKL